MSYAFSTRTTMLAGACVLALAFGASAAPGTSGGSMRAMSPTPRPVSAVPSPVSPHPITRPDGPMAHPGVTTRAPEPVTGTRLRAPMPVAPRENSVPRENPDAANREPETSGGITLDPPPR